MQQTLRQLGTPNLDAVRQDEGAAEPARGNAAVEEGPLARVPGALARTTSSRSSIVIDRSASENPATAMVMR